MKALLTLLFSQHLLYDFRAGCTATGEHRPALHNGVTTTRFSGDASRTRRYTLGLPCDDPIQELDSTDRRHSRRAVLATDLLVWLRNELCRTQD